jgi:hypothetical protein
VFVNQENGKINIDLSDEFLFEKKLSKFNFYMIPHDSEPFDMGCLRRDVTFGSDRAEVSVNPETVKFRIALSGEFLFGKKSFKFNFYVISHDSDLFDMGCLRQNVTFPSDRVEVEINQKIEILRLFYLTSFFSGKGCSNLISRQFLMILTHLIRSVSKKSRLSF